MINENDLAILIIPHTLDDTRTFCRLSQVSKRFNQVSKKMLIQKKGVTQDGNYVWMELPNGQRHGLCRVWYLFGQLYYEYNTIHNIYHGLYRGWFPNGQLMLEMNYQNGRRHGIERVWDSNGQLVSDKRYSNGSLIANMNH